MFIYRFCLEHARRFKKTFNYSGDVLNQNCAKSPKPYSWIAYGFGVQGVVLVQQQAHH